MWILRNKKGEGRRRRRRRRLDARRCWSNTRLCPRIIIMGGRFPKFPVVGGSDECLPRSSRRTQGSSHGHPHPTSRKLQRGQADYPSPDETISATSLLHQTISRLNKEIRQKTTEITELSRIINARHKAQLETEMKVELLVQEQLSKIKKQLSTDIECWSEIVEECKSVYAHITENTEFLEPKKAAQTSDSRRSSSSSSALIPAERIQAAKSYNFQEEMRVKGMTQKERELEDQVNIRVESKTQQIRQGKEETVRYYKGEYDNLLAKQSNKMHNSHSQNYQNELRQQLQVHEEAHARELKDASTCHQHQLAALREHREADMAALTERAKYFEKRYLETQSRMQKAEKLLADHAFVDSASYRDDSATPTLLQAAADGVKGAVSMCASSIFKFIHAHSLPINLEYLVTVLGQHQLDVNVHNRKLVVKMALQAFLCAFFFQGFENTAYSSTQTFQSSTIVFERPEIRRKQRFQDFKRLRYLEPVQMREQDHEFDSFLKAKAAFVGNEIFNLLQIHNGHESTEQAEAHKQLISSELLGSSPSSPFFKSFLRLAKAAWQLHKLAFACEPASAEIFRVAPNSVFLGDYMEEHEDTRSKTTSLSLHEDNEDVGKLVTLMNVPGFTVRNSVIRSVVCCMHSAGPSHESTR